MGPIIIKQKVLGLNYLLENTKMHTCCVNRYGATQLSGGENILCLHSRARPSRETLIGAHMVTHVYPAHIRLPQDKSRLGGARVDN